MRGNIQLRIFFTILGFIMFLFTVLTFVKTYHLERFLGFGEGEQTSSEQQIQGVTIKGISVDARIADTPEERAKGLMYVESLSENEGMLFIYESDVLDSFWMKNMNIPLDMIFINGYSEDYQIVDIKKNVLPCTTDLCPSYSSSKPYRYVVEVNGGWCDKNKVGIGDVVILEASTAQSGSN